MQSAMFLQKLSDLSAAVRCQPVPEQDDVPRQLSQELLKKFDHPVLVDRLVGVQPQQQSRRRRRGLIVTAPTADRC